MANNLRIRKLHRKLAELAGRFFSVCRDLAPSCRTSVDECEYALDIA